ncbi:DUF885 domain-containing protein [Nakamurella flavida]|uniref:DUF885 domain-containing protein n=1 Tax=Nakamurella flavida TaxID=363630 RepID=A0A939C3W7_9ACTN|nr:DUF885 domain-containing protein [Nakamurella flavida]MBM9478110.1 DUF885 domain-containing protein [Nakamurella flavida]MDP9778669.1 uncharacterized protein (DUF885 family) [Nakamurella flavida]
MTPTLPALADELVEAVLRNDPFGASQFGLPQYDAFAPDASPAAEAAYRAELTRIGDAAAGILADPADTVLQAAIASTVRAELNTLDVGEVDFTVTALPLSGPPVLFSTAASTVVPDEQSAQAYLARLTASAHWIDTVTDRLRAGAARGLTPVRSLAENALSWADAVLGEPAPAALTAPAAPQGWDGAEAWRAEVHRLAAEVVSPAVRRWRDLVAQELLPVARDDDHAGIGHLPDGEARYLAAIERHTTLPLTPQELHETGLTAVRELEERALVLGARIGLDDLPAIRAAVAAGADPDPEAAMERARVAILRAEARAADVIDPPLPDPCVVSPMPDTVGRSGMAPHYTLPRADGSRPGTYWFNTVVPGMGVGWELEAVAFHEAVPGHHLQLARAQADTSLPRLVTQTLVNAHAEGWGLYTERLAGELGLYSSVQQEIGAVFMEMHRAARLVVDSGVHGLGWSRQKARGYLVDHIPVSRDFLFAEMDRYIAWPGQALAYLVGQQEILRLRDEARATLGEKFTLQGFHSAVLESGSLPLPALQVVVRRWIEGVTAGV